MQKIANIITDEKFIDCIIDNNNKYPMDLENEYIYIYIYHKPQFRYIKNKDSITLISIFRIINYLKTNNFKAVFLHSLYSMPLYLINKIPSRIKVFWMAWGYDIYYLPIKNPIIKVELFHKETKTYLFKKKVGSNNKKNFKNLIIKLKQKLKKKIFFGINECKQYEKAIKRIDYFSGVLNPTEYDMMKQNPVFTAESFIYSYMIPIDTNNYIKKSFTGDNILIGNSGDPSNNHLDIFENIKNITLNNKKVFIPLSYGGTEDYKNKIVKEAYNKFHDNFIPLLKFIGFEEYSAIIDSCSVGIFMHERQQGMGNINLLIERGAKVFLSETSIHFKHLKNIGFKVFSIQKDLNYESLNTPLSKNDQDHNKNLIIKLKSKEKYFQIIKDFQDKIIN